MSRPSLDSRTVISMIEEVGWCRVGQEGSHIQFKHAELPGRVTIAHPKKDIPIGTLKSIERQAGVKFEQKGKKWAPILQSSTKSPTGPRLG